MQKIISFSKSNTSQYFSLNKKNDILQFQLAFEFIVFPTMITNQTEMLAYKSFFCKGEFLGGHEMILISFCTSFYFTH